MMEWASENEPAEWNHYFNYISLNRAVWNIRDGKISPWLILNCKSGKDMLSKFNDEQLKMVYNVMKSPKLQQKIYFYYQTHIFFTQSQKTIHNYTYYTLFKIIIIKYIIIYTIKVRIEKDCESILKKCRILNPT